MFATYYVKLRTFATYFVKLRTNSYSSPNFFRSYITTPKL
jgi:hypothetical protein